MIQRVMPGLMGLKNILVLNDEAHHCYRTKPEVDEMKRKRPRKITKPRGSGSPALKPSSESWALPE
jgi:hypothetical protein